MMGMRGLAGAAIAGALWLAGCATPAPPEVAAAIAETPAPAASEVQVAPVLPAYVCPDGRKVVLDHDASVGVMRVTRGDENWVLQQQVGKTPASFVSGLDTVTVGDGEARLKRGRAERMVCQQVPAEPVRGIIWGTLSKMDRAALVPGTRAKVLLVDAARADAPAIEIASTAIVTEGNQVPLHYLIRYDPERVSPRGMTYRLQARFETPQGQLTHITDTASFVLESDAPQPPMELMLKRVG